MLRKVDDFMDLDFEQYLKGVQKQVSLESLRGAKPYIKNEVFVTKLLNGCDAAGGQLFDSFEQEYITEAKANEPPEMHAQWLMKELGLDSEQALVNFFVERLREEEKREAYKKFKNSLKKELEPQPHQKTTAKHPHLRHRHHSNRQGGKAGRRRPAHLRVSMPHLSGYGSPADSPSMSPERSALLKRQHTREMVELQLKRTHQHELTEKVARYHRELGNERRAIADRIRAQETRERHREDPSLAPDLLDLVEDNVS